MGKIFGGIEAVNRSRDSSEGQARSEGTGSRSPRQSLERLYNFQHADGGWGWWKEGESDHFMTAYVLWGLTLARQAGIEVKQDVAERAASYLDKELVEEEANYDQQAWMLHALAVYHAGSLPASSPGRGVTRICSSVSQFQAKAFDNLWTNRDKLNAYTRALLALAAHNFGYADKAKTLIENLENGVKIDSKPDTSIVQQRRAVFRSVRHRPRPTGAKTDFTGAGRKAASKRLRLRCARCWQSIRKTNSSSRSPTG